VGILLDRVTDTRYPSAPMLDRVEAAIVDVDMAEDYVERLLETVEQDRYPSPQMLDRLNKLISVLEAAGSG
jgi:hypothetical protein